MPLPLPFTFHLVAMGFVFAFGACCGSFLNVVVLRVPVTRTRVQGSLWETFWTHFKGVSDPPSHCPRCGARLKWHQNLPIIGWLRLGGKCGSCGLPISPIYPIVETSTAVLFTGLYVCFFLLGPAWGPPTPTEAISVALAPNVVMPQALPGDPEPAGLIEATQLSLPYGQRGRFEVVDAELLPEAMNSRFGRVQVVQAVVRERAFVNEHWHVLLISVILVWCLLAGSIIDWNHFVIPRFFCYFPAFAGLLLHTLFGERGDPLSLHVGPVGAAWAMGGGAGLVLITLFGIVRFYLSDRSSDETWALKDDSPPEEAVHPIADPLPQEPTRGEVTKGIAGELILFAVPLALAIIAAALAVGPMRPNFALFAANDYVSGFLGSLLGGLVGGGVIWAVRLLGTLAFGREAMGLGDVDLMFGVGCCIGAAPAGLAVFPASLVGLVFAVGKLISKRWQEIPFGPYLAIGSVLFLLFFNHVADYLREPMLGVAFLLGPAAPYFGL